MKRSGTSTTATDSSSQRHKHMKTVPSPGRNMVPIDAKNTAGGGYGDTFSSSPATTPLGDASNINRGAAANSSGRSKGRKGNGNSDAKSSGAECAAPFTGAVSSNQNSSTACTLVEKATLPGAMSPRNDASLSISFGIGTGADAFPPPVLAPSRDDHRLQQLENQLREKATRLEETNATVIRERRERLVELKRATEEKKEVTRTVEALTSSTGNLCTENKVLRQCLQEKNETILLLDTKLALKGDKKRQAELHFKQQRILALYHAKHCPHESGTCPGTSWGLPGKTCQELKNLLLHLEEGCSVIDGKCQVQHCSSSKVLHYHYSNCKNDHCVICQPYIRKAAASGTADASRPSSFASLAQKVAATKITSLPSSFARREKSTRSGDERSTQLASDATTLASSTTLSKRERGHGGKLRSTDATSKALRAVDTTSSSKLPGAYQNAPWSASTLAPLSSTGRNRSSEPPQPVEPGFGRSIHSAANATSVFGDSTDLRKKSPSSTPSRTEKSRQLRGVDQFDSDRMTHARFRQQREVTMTENAALANINAVGVLTCSACSTEQPMNLCSACTNPNLQLLQHSASCEDDDGCCGWPRCIEMKTRLRHVETCDIGFARKCHTCRLVVKLIQLHARECQLVTCAVPLCLSIQGCANCSDLSTRSGVAPKSLCSACDHPMQELLRHSVDCMDKECQVPQCDRMTYHLEHWTDCEVRSGGGCTTCLRTWAVIRSHARYCQTTPCPVPSCQFLR